MVCVAAATAATLLAMLLLLLRLLLVSRVLMASVAGMLVGCGAARRFANPSPSGSDICQRRIRGQRVRKGLSGHEEMRPVKIMSSTLAIALAGRVRFTIMVQHCSPFLLSPPPVIPAPPLVT